MSDGPNLDILARPYQADNREEVTALAPRLTVGIAPWRSADGMLAAAQKWITVSLDDIGPDRAVFVAARADRSIPGFVSVSGQKEFTGEARVYVGELAVAENAEGAGIGRALLAAVETWARRQGLGLIVLETGAGNSRARRFYERAGFREESVKLTKVLQNGMP